MPCSFRIINEMLPEIPTMQKCDFTIAIIHSQIIQFSDLHFASTLLFIIFLSFHILWQLGRQVPISVTCRKMSESAEKEVDDSKEDGNYFQCVLKKDTSLGFIGGLFIYTCPLERIYFCRKV